jgi:hypothetical protein
MGGYYFQSISRSDGPNKTVMLGLQLWRLGDADGVAVEIAICSAGYQKMLNVVVVLVSKK